MERNPRYIMLGGDIVEDRVAVVDGPELRSKIAALASAFERMKSEDRVIVVDSLALNHERHGLRDLDIGPEAVQILGDFHAGLERKRYTERLDQMLAAARSESLRVDRNRRKQRSRKRRGK